jgi:hypothetical protein
MENDKNNEYKPTREKINFDSPMQRRVFEKM